MPRRLAVPEAWRPVKVCVIDAEQCPATISRAPNYGAMWALVRDGGRPRGVIKLPFLRDALHREELLQAIAALPPAVIARPLRPAASDHLPAISVVIATTFERRPLLDACLRSLATLDYPDYELIVVDNRPAGSGAVKLPGATVIREPRPGLSAARNRGLAAAQADIVALTDDDVEVDPAWLLAIALRLQAHQEEVCVTGLVFPRELETPAQVEFEDYYDGFGPRTFDPVSHRMRMPAGSGTWLTPSTVEAVGDDGRCRSEFSLYLAGNFGVGANMAFRTQTLRELGGFELALGPGTLTRNGEELAAFARLAWRGHSLGFEPAALVHHVHRREHAALRRQIGNYGLGFSAMLTALVLEDPRHLGRMLGTVPKGVRAVSRGYRRKLDSQQPNRSTRGLAVLELRGMAMGPAAYLRSRRIESR
jgi:Glycosyl transferase family 2